MTINTVTRLFVCVGLVVVLVATIGAHSGPAPVITSSVSAGKKQESTVSDVDADQKASNVQQQNLNTEEEISRPTSDSTTTTTTTTTTDSLSQTKGPQHQSGTNSNNPKVANQKSPMRSLNAEKLRRGLTNFMNHANPAPFFVPPAPLSGSGVVSVANKNNNNNKNIGSQAEPATIITDGPTADAVIKGPNRLVQGRPLGGPLRWGRR